MASVEECRAALDQLVEQLGEVDEATRAKHVVERTLSCHVSDLDVTFRGRIHRDGLDTFNEQIACTDHQADVRITISSDDLVRLVNGELDMPRALLGGRVKIEASIGDLFRLRRLL